MIMEVERPLVSPPGRLDFPTEVELLRNGNVLIVDGGYWTGDGGELIEVDRAGNIVWRYGGDLHFPHGCKETERGSFVLADTLSNRIIEVDRSGTVLWSSAEWGAGAGTLSDGSRLSYPNDVELLPDGNLLITDRNNNRAIIVDRAGRIHWKYDRLDHPHNADLLENGNILVANSNANRVDEISPGGKVIWTYGGSGLLNWPRDADRLADGRTLIADSRNHRVLMIDPGGRVIWEYKTEKMSLPYEADILPNGNVLIVDQRYARVIEVDSFGNVVWCFRNFFHPDPLPARVVNPDFAKAAEGGRRPAAWICCDLVAEGRAQFLWGDCQGAGGKAVGIAYRGPATVWWQQTVGIRPGRTYGAVVRMKARGVEGGVQVLLAFVDENGGFLDDPRSLPGGKTIKGTTDWVEDRFEIRVPERARAVDIRLALIGSGEAWFDSFKFSELVWE